MNQKQIAIILGVMCLLLTMGIAIQVRTVTSSNSAVGKTQTENELRDSVLRWQEKYDTAYAKEEKLEKELESLREQVSSNDDSSTGLSDELLNYQNLLGYTELVGPGIIITLNDGDSSAIKNIVTDLIVHDSDIYQVVNALRNAGAEAISVNGQRIMNSSAITCVGNVIKINGEKVGAPFEISAIGSVSMLYGSLTMPGGYLETLKNDGVEVTIEKVEKSTIVISKYESIFKFVYASRAE